VHSRCRSSMEKKSLSTHENADLFLGMVKLQPEDISIVAKMGTFLMWYDSVLRSCLTPPTLSETRFCANYETNRLPCPLILLNRFNGYSSKQ
jgi:hypothetical protein